MDTSSDDEPLAATKAAALAKRPAEDSSDDEAPLAPPKDTEQTVKRRKAAPKSLKEESDSSDEEPLAAIKKRASPKKKAAPKKKASPKKKPATKKRKVETESEYSDDSSDDEPLSQKAKKRKTVKKPAKKKPAKKAAAKRTTTKKEVKKEEEEVIFKWWEVPEHPDGIKWLTLSHKGPKFPPPYKPLPKNVHLKYDGKPFALSPEAEEVAGFFAVMLDSDYMQKDQFKTNFWKCWRKEMTSEERKHITDLGKCDFHIIQEHYKKLSEERKAASKEEKKKRKEDNEAVKAVFGVAMVDGQKQNVGNFNIEPPGLFRGRGDHPKMGMLKKRVMPEQVTINIGKEAEVPVPPEGHKWKSVQHDNKVTWLASWNENIQGANKYVMLATDSSIKGRNDWKKYETARRLKKHVDNIRRDYTVQLKDKERQRATALYLIDRLALRAGGSKDADEEADTVGCCNLRVEHINCLEDDTIELDFLGKDSIRYYNKVKVHPQVWKNLRLFKKPPKTDGDDLFDRLTSSLLNEYLHKLMDGLTAKVFRTYNASTTLQKQLKATPEDGSLEEKLLAYTRANKEVAVLCNHQRAPPKKHGEQMDKLDGDIEQIKKDYAKAKKELKAAKSSGGKVEQLKKKVARLKDRLHKKEIAKVAKQELKTIALGTSKLNYLDPRISVAWTKKHDVPIAKVYNKTQQKKFRWASEMTEADFEF